MERETGIEPATNSLEGCDSTTELLPPSCSLPSLSRICDAPARRRTAHLLASQTSVHVHSRAVHVAASRPRGNLRLTCNPPSLCALRGHASPGLAAVARRRKPTASEGWWGGEGSNLRSPKAAGLQPAAIDRSATSPNFLSLPDSVLRSRLLDTIRPGPAESGALASHMSSWISVFGRFPALRLAPRPD